MNGRLKLNNAAFQRSFLIISAGIVLALILLNYLLPRRSPPEYRPKTTSLPSAQSSQNSGERQATPTERQATPIPTLELQTVTQVLAVQTKNCTYTEEYWGTNPQAWGTDNMVIGQFSFSKQEGLTLINTATEDTPTLLQKQFLVATLNILNGADPTPIGVALSEASQWVDDHPPELEMAEPDRNIGIVLIQRLTDYNHGLLGPVLCLDQPPTSTATATRAPTATQTLAVNANSILPTTGATPTRNRDEQGSPRDLPKPAPPSPQPTDPPIPPTNPPPEATQVPEPTDAPLPTSAPPPPEAPNDTPPEEIGATQPPDIGDILATPGVPLP